MGGRRKGLGWVICIKRGADGVPGKRPKGLAAAGACHSMCEELPVAGEGFWFCQARGPARKVRQVDGQAPLGL